MNKFYILRSNWTPKLIIIFGFDLWRVGYDCVNNFSFKLNFAQFFFSFCEIYAYIFSISAQVCSDPMISLKISCLILSVHYVLLLSIWSFIWLVIPFCVHTGMVPFHFGHSFLVIPFVSYRDGAIFILIVELINLFAHYFFGLTICFSGMVPFSFESLEAFVGRYNLAFWKLWGKSRFHKSVQFASIF